MNDGNISVTITSGTILRIILLVIGVALFFYLRDLLLVILTAVVIASSIEPAVHMFSKHSIPRLPAVIIVYLLIAISFVAFFFFFVPPLLDDAIGFLGHLPEQLTTWGVVAPTSFSSGLIDFSSLASLQDFFMQFKEAVSGASGGVIKTASSIFGGALSFILILVLSFYFAVQETGIDDFLRIVSPVKYQEYVVGLWKRSQVKIGLWMQGQILLAVIMGVLVYLSLSILQVPHPLLLAVLAAICELIPLFGPIIAAIPAVALAFAESGASLGLMVGALYLILQQFENHLIYPLVVRKVIGVPPLLVIIALIAGAKIAGFLGIILSVPLSAAIKEYVDDLGKVRGKGGNSIPMP